jgi:hypothetical protein
LLLRSHDLEALRRQFRQAEPFPFFKVDNLLDLGFAKEAAAAYPAFEVALGQGRAFNAVNERRKVQVTDASLFPEPVLQLKKLLASPEFLLDLSYVTGIPKLLADDELVGGGMHMTGPGGRLDVHVDFNFLEDRELHRRLNLLLYLNPTWEESWGGHIQLWDKDVKQCRQSFAPALNRCVIFETSESSFHGVVPIAHNAPHPRISFATYYYTKEAPAGWDGKVHSTVFKARPEERIRAYLLMPAAKMRQRLLAGARSVKRNAKRLTGSTVGRP